TDLDLRPIYHQKDKNTMAHLHLGLLAYWVVNTVRYQLKQNGINSGWREIVRIMNTQKAVTKKKKSVVHKSELEEAQLTEQQFFWED
ncbi:MAG: family transposase, partial [Bacteroidetes bacterium]|nr:family transposase [Bacteroidota bacterium]